jgi:hexosaminidase
VTTALRRTAPLLLLTGLTSLARAQAAPAVSVIPYPASVTVDAGVHYTFGPAPTIALSAPSNAELRALGDLAAGILRDELGGRPRVVSAPASSARADAVALVLAPADSGQGPESYRLAVTHRGVTITAPRTAGLFYGLQTLRALVEPKQLATSAERHAANATLQGMHIADAPRFTYRGMHLDVGRHFAPVPFVKRYIDLMSRYKLNTFHWHLTEDQGWRIEIKKYPRLTEVGGCRKETQLGRFRTNPYVGDSIRYCGFYTQDQIRDVVAYAKDRHITVIPEIEMPGHSVAALTAYPELACKPGPYEVRTTWGVDENILCPKEETFTFIENVLTEVMALFPCQYVHIGGDEAPKTVWQASPIAQEVIKRENLKDEHELQSYFIRRVEKFLNAHGKRIIGWDEILEGGLAPNATVMSWRGINGGIAAARANHDVVMTPTSNTYLDYNQGDPRFESIYMGARLPLMTVYAYEPIPDSLTAEQGKHVLGTQGQLWTEYMQTTRDMEYMAFPREMAIAEVAWSPKAARSWDSFGRRLLPRLLALDRLGVNYRFPGVESGLEKNQAVAGDTVTVTLGTPIPDAEIRYTLDGSEPTITSTKYTGPLHLTIPADGSISVVARAFLDEHHASPSRAATFRRAATTSAR